MCRAFDKNLQISDLFLCLGAVFGGLGWTLKNFSDSVNCK